MEKAKVMERKTGECKRNQKKRGTSKTAAEVRRMEAELDFLSGGRAMFWTAPNCPPEIRMAGLREVLAFENIGSGTPLFEGLRERGIALPHPETLNEQQCSAKAAEVINALLELWIILVGFESMSPRQLYVTLWSQTLWEGCYIKKRTPGAVTILDVSHSVPHAEMPECREDIESSYTIH